MRRKNLIARKKANRNQFLKNKKIHYLYSKFKSIILKSIKNKSFALAVSGGPDSLCLAFFGKLYSLENNNRIKVLIVDHKLRKESKKEAIKVKKLLTQKKIPSRILSWKGKIPSKNIQKNARDIRYSLLSDFCLKNKIKYLLTAHHEGDQIENFFIRLSRGSGVSGLSSMSVYNSYSKNLKIIRPFLNFTKDDLKYATLKYFKNYIKDPSNKNEKFLRIKIRKLNKILMEDKKIFDAKKIKKTINNLTLAKNALSFYKTKAMYKYTRFVPKKSSNGYEQKCTISKNIFLHEADEIVFKLFSEVLSEVSKSYYPPRSKKILNLIDRLKIKKVHKSTLGGCIVESDSNNIIISKELNKRKISNQLKNKNFA
tara:strand:- start:10670 stop:11776 length:1107 start_codon:yes stop_codon:yes gene_type:complete